MRRRRVGKDIRLKSSIWSPFALDLDTIVESIKKTNRLVIVEGFPVASIATEITYRVQPRLRPYRRTDPSPLPERHPVRVRNELDRRGPASSQRHRGSMQRRSLRRLTKPFIKTSLDQPGRTAAL